MKRLWSILIVVLLFSLVMVTTGCTAKGTSKEGYDELKYQLTVAQAQLSDTRGELEARLSKIQEDLEAQLSDIQEELEAQRPPVDEEPVGSQKLVGSGGCVEWTYPGETDVNHLDTGFFLTNPDCVSEITIERIFVFAHDGTVLYEGPLRVKVNHEWELYTGPLKPHEKLQTSLSYYDLPDITHEVEMYYTVEVFWKWADKEGLPLIGWATSVNVVRDGGTGEAIDIIMWGTIQMVNMEQKLEPKD